MILHCAICSVQGTHMSEDSAIATIDESKLKLPLTSEMFTSINPERDIPVPWRQGVDWQTMQCPRGSVHLPWGIEYQDIDQAIRDGGPKQLLTDKGKVDVPVPNPVEQNLNPNVQIFTCEKCGRSIKSRLAFTMHQRVCKGKVE